MGLRKATKLSSVYDTLHVGIALYDPETGTILDANDHLETLTGYASEELRRLSVSAYTANTYPHSEAKFKSRLRTCLADGPIQFTWRMKRADGELIWVQVHLSPQTVPGGDAVRVEVRDITDYYETHHRAELFWRMLRHNLRNEATIIGGHVDRIEASAEAESVRDVLATVRSRVERLGRMAESVSEIEQAVSQTDTQRIRRHVTEAVRDTVERVTAAYPAANVTVTERKEMWIHADDAFMHALTHALENAIVHSDASEPVVEVTVGPSPNTGRVEIRIVDSNSPIPDNEIDALSGPADIQDTSHGSGVGLFVMKWCIESLGGEIKFDRSDSRGNTVYFYLPPKSPP
ncbi:PAS domain-containing sensor histidine kinase [Halapricum hydrolyticum]|uniref:histidine kinase n=1 Tax=Halapricum hydrolyticum TaxID=2979991 RepID=A0AAE3IGC2_9EURY|nr:PAS domain-containing sensor histidine kinase [Halapricum hydrolyticum]MCU4719109.1 PAS domain-containing sensor histidine kinase [Halapricum hydrolyticum]MCU4728119.1 PAS domain-containing sensor histidine kinase [Halapricum hydrolyticum]